MILSLRAGYMWVALLLATVLPFFPGTTRAEYEVTFFLAADTHYKGGDADPVNIALGERVLKMNALPGVELPGARGPVGTPRGVIHAGDVLDGYEGLENEWRHFETHFGLDGSDGWLNFPVYEGYGNHDTHFPLASIAGLISARNEHRPGVTHVSAPYTYPQDGGRYAGSSVDGVHYAWKWGPVHFVQTNMRVGDGTDRFAAAGSLSFLRDYLENVVGDTGAAVVIIHHLNIIMQETEWPEADRLAYYDLIKDYNIVAILHGHQHGPLAATSWNGIRVFKTPALVAGGVTVFKITSDANDPDKAEMMVAARDLDTETWSPVHTEVIDAPLPVGRNVVDIVNPYSQVSWQTFNRYRTNLHAHTTESDGDDTPQAMIDAYQAMGYDVLALTDHNNVTWPWTAYDRDPATLGMLALRGSEASSHNHIVSLFNDYSGTGVSDIETSFQTIGANGGVSIIAHPGRYSSDFASRAEELAWYIDVYNRHPHILGMEVYGYGDRYPGDRALWDQLLAEMLPGRPVWGFSSDDAHRVGHVGRDWQTLLLPELTEAGVRSALETGQFVFHYAPTAGDPAPVINAIDVDEAAGTITIDASGWTSIQWISDGVAINTTDTTLDVSALRGYVRAALQGPTGRTYTQPFYVMEPDNTLPARPSHLTATVASSSQINLSWADNSPNENGFEIERKAGPDGEWVLLEAVPENQTAHADTGLELGTTYTYRVRAFNANGESGWSNEAFATAAVMLPAAPDGLSATVATSTRIDLAWTDNAGNETGFEIERKAGVDGTWAPLATAGANAVSYSDLSAVASTPYFYRVRAVNTDGPSAWSNEAYATILIYTWVEREGNPYVFTWNADANWQEPGFPNAPQAQATLFNTISGTRTINIALGQDITVGRITANESSNANFFFQAGSTLTLDNGQQAAVWTRNRSGSTTSGALRMHIYTNLHLASSLEASWSLAREMYLDNQISGPGALVIHHYASDSTANNRRLFFRGGANTYAGGTVLNGTGGSTRISNFVVEKNNAFGTGDVTLNEFALLTLTDRGATDNMIADSAALRLTQAAAGNSVVALNAGVNETVGRLYINGAAQAAGTWGSSTSTAQHKNDTFFTGPGILTVKELTYAYIVGDEFEPAPAFGHAGPGVLSVSMNGLAGRQYLLERSLSLLDPEWVTVAESGVRVTDGPLQLSDEESSTHDAAFYRVRIVYDPQ